VNGQEGQKEEERKEREKREEARTTHRCEIQEEEHSFLWYRCCFGNNRFYPLSSW